MANHVGVVLLGQTEPWTIMRSEEACQYTRLLSMAVLCRLGQSGSENVVERLPGLARQSIHTLSIWRIYGVRFDEDGLCVLE